MLEFERPLVIGQELLTSISSLFLTVKKIEVLPLNISRAHLPISLSSEARDYTGGTLSLSRSGVAELVTLELMALFIRPAGLLSSRLA